MSEQWDCICCLLYAVSQHNGHWFRHWHWHIGAFTMPSASLRPSLCTSEQEGVFTRPVLIETACYLLSTYGLCLLKSWAMCCAHILAEPLQNKLCHALLECACMRCRFGHETMPLANLMRNCAYYWGFAAYVSYFNNHPLYTAPAVHQSLIALGLAMLCQLGNLRWGLGMPSAVQSLSLPSVFPKLTAASSQSQASKLVLLIGAKGKAFTFVSDT